MNIIVGIKTFAPVQHRRMGHLENCIRSAVREFGAEHVVVVNNGDLDHEAVEEVARDAGIAFVIPLRGDESQRTPGHGASFLIKLCALYNGHLQPGPLSRWPGPRIVVHSDDDMIWRHGAKVALEEIWKHAPARLLICSGLLEPDYPWATVRRAEDLGSQRVLIRDNAPGCAWSLRASDSELVASLVERRFGFDHEACKRAIAEGFEVAQADLAKHAGWGASTHGNQAIDAPTTKPLDREKWGI